MKSDKEKISEELRNLHTAAYKLRQSGCAYLRRAADLEREAQELELVLGRLE